MYLFDLSPAVLEDISEQTSPASMRGPGQGPGAAAPSRPLLGTPARPAGKRSRFQATAPGPCPLHTTRWHLETCAQSSNPQLVHQRPAAPLDGGDVAYPSGRFVPTKPALVTPQTTE